jgi:hypothetical protein
MGGSFSVATVSEIEAKVLNNNKESLVRERVAARQVPWKYPAMVVVGRSVFILLAQALVAVIFAFRGAPHPWLAAAPWWTIYGTLVDAGCLALMWTFTRREGIGLRSLIGPIRLRYGRDLLLGIAVLAAVFPCFFIGASVSTRLLYQGTQPYLYPGILGARVLPFWAWFYSHFIWWVIWSPTEEMTYAGYALPRLQALSHRTWVAVAFVGFWWTIQHPFLPFIPDWRLFVWRFCAFLPGILMLCLIYLRIRRLPPLILAHWTMDIIAVLMTTS